MVAGHLREKKGYYHMVLFYTDKNGKRYTPSKTTGLRVTGNKRKALAMLDTWRQEVTEQMEAGTLFPESISLSSSDGDKLEFTSFLKKWLEMRKSSLEVTTYTSYKFVINNRVSRYFDKNFPHLKLKDLTPLMLQDYYTHLTNDLGLTANTAIHHHAPIRKALQYAFKVDLISCNPADKVERPKQNPYVADYYTGEELKMLFQLVRGTILELPVLFAAFYGLRRSEVIGLKWDAIDFENKTISIRHTIVEQYENGHRVYVARDRTKTQSSRRTLPLVGPFEDALLRLRNQIEENRKTCGDCYNTDYLDYINVDILGNLISPDMISRRFPELLQKNGMRRIRFHDLRHSCASLLYANGVPLKDIQIWLGHSTINTTANIYTHLTFTSSVSSANAIMDFCPTYSLVGTSIAK